MRTSPSFQALWKEFVTKAVAVDPHPILYQYVTNQAFEALIQETFQTSNVQQTSAEPLTYGEENALGYVARYVCHKAPEDYSIKTPNEVTSLYYLWINSARD